LSTDLLDADLGRFDVCVVAHVTRDVIRSGGARRSLAGGVAYYAGLTLHRLGRRVAVITKMAPEDQVELLWELRREGITVVCGDSAETTVFNNEYREGDPNSRVQTVTSIAAPFAPSDLESVRADWFYLGPLLSQDMSAKFMASVPKQSKIALDAQGLVRKIEGEKIQTVRPAETGALMRSVSLLKVDALEAATLSGVNGHEEAARRLHALGAQEVIVTFASKGSMIFDGQEFHYIDPIAGKEVDTTGCGDTYLAAYLARRLASDGPELNGRFAAAAATLALEQEGAFRAGAPEVRARMRACE
jgi:sugar/nucleoside kinase (ribokinase family)